MVYQRWIIKLYASLFGYHVLAGEISISIKEFDVIRSCTFFWGLGKKNIKEVMEMDHPKASK